MRRGGSAAVGSAPRRELANGSPSGRTPVHPLRGARSSTLRRRHRTPQKRPRGAHPVKGGEPGTCRGRRVARAPPGGAFVRRDERTWAHSGPIAPGNMFDYRTRRGCGPADGEVSMTGVPQAPRPGRPRWGSWCWRPPPAARPARRSSPAPTTTSSSSSRAPGARARRAVRGLLHRPARRRAGTPSSTRPASPDVTHVDLSTRRHQAPVAYAQRVVLERRPGVGAMNGDKLRDMRAPVHRRRPGPGRDAIRGRRPSSRSATTTCARRSASGVHVVYSYDLGQGREVFDQIAMVGIAEDPGLPAPRRAATGLLRPPPAARSTTCLVVHREGPVTPTARCPTPDPLEVP